MTKPGHGMKVFGGVVGVLAASSALFYAIRLGGKVYNILLLLFVGGWRWLFHYNVGGVLKREFNLLKNEIFV